MRELKDSIIVESRISPKPKMKSAVMSMIVTKTHIAPFDLMLTPSFLIILGYMVKDGFPLFINS